MLSLVINENGQAMVEYGLIMGFVALVAFALLINIQIPLSSFFETVEAILINYN